MLRASLPGGGGGDYCGAGSAQPMTTWQTGVKAAYLVKVLRWPLDWSWVVALAKEAGVPGAALLILIAGVAFNLHKGENHAALCRRSLLDQRRGDPG